MILGMGRALCESAESESAKSAQVKVQAAWMHNLK